MTGVTKVCIALTLYSLKGSAVGAPQEVMECPDRDDCVCRRWAVFAMKLQSCRQIVPSWKTCWPRCSTLLPLKLPSMWPCMWLAWRARYACLSWAQWASPDPCSRGQCEHASEQM